MHFGYDPRTQSYFLYLLAAFMTAANQNLKTKCAFTPVQGSREHLFMYEMWQCAAWSEWERMPCSCCWVFLSQTCCDILWGSRRRYYLNIQSIIISDFLWHDWELRFQYHLKCWSKSLDYLLPICDIPTSRSWAILSVSVSFTRIGRSLPSYIIVIQWYAVNLQPYMGRGCILTKAGISERMDSLVKIILRWVLACFGNINIRSFRPNICGG
jgi:hypothetical protein